MRVDGKLAVDDGGSARTDVRTAIINPGEAEAHVRVPEDPACGGSLRPNVSPRRFVLRLPSCHGPVGRAPARVRRVMLARTARGFR